MPALTIKINRAPVLTLWIATVAHHEGYDWDTSLTIGKVYAGLNAQAKGPSSKTSLSTHGTSRNTS